MAAGLGSTGKSQRQTFFLDHHRQLALGAKGPKELAAAGRRPDDSQRKYKIKSSPVQHQDIPPIPIQKKTPTKRITKAHAAMYTGALGGNQPQGAKELFQHLDTNKDGTISYAEFSRGLARHSVQAKLSHMAMNAGSGYTPHGTVLGKNDPLNLKEPPRSVVEPAFADAQDYGIGGLNPDSLAADVKVLTMQKQMLSDEARWWNDMAESESAARPGLQEELQTQELAFKQEAADMQRQIEKCRKDLNYYEERTRELTKETRDYIAEANAAQAEMEVLRKMLVSHGVPEAQLRAAFSKSQSHPHGVRSQIRRDEFDDDDDVEELLRDRAKGASSNFVGAVDFDRLGFK